MKLLFTLWCIMGTYGALWSQHTNYSLSVCGTVPTTQEINDLSQHRAAIQKYQINSAKSIINIPLSIHLLSYSNQEGALSDVDLTTALASLNEHFLPANIQFYTCGIEQIASDIYYNFNKGQENEVTNTYNIENTLNIYFFNTIVGNNGLLCGYTYLPAAGKDHIMISMNCLENGNSLIHEMGHYFGLYHTHGKSSIALTDELADGSNCTTAGDEVCDTPADPNLRTLLGNDCSYIGELLDDNQQRYQPDTRNIMSYADANCRDHFSVGQYERMAYFVENTRNYLSCPDFTIDFSADRKATLCATSLEVQFTSLITNNLSSTTIYAWDVDGDGETDYQEANPRHIYEEGGDYTVSLTISNGITTIEKVKTNYISLMSAMPTPWVDEITEGLDAWRIENPDEKMTWKVGTTDACGVSNKVVHFNNFDYNALTQKDYLYSRRIDLRHNEEATLRFRLAYAPYSADYSDKLKVEISTDCFATLGTTIYEKSGMDLATAGTSMSAYVPTDCSEWREEVIDLSDYVGQQVSFRFININGYGNHLYLDDLDVSGEKNISAPINNTDTTGEVVNDDDTITLEWGGGGLATSDEPFIENSNNGEVLPITIYPNPASEQLFIAYKSELSERINYQIIDTWGRSLKIGQYEVVSGLNNLKLTINQFDSGVYWLQILNAKSNSQHKFVVE